MKRFVEFLLILTIFTFPQKPVKGQESQPPDFYSPTVKSAPFTTSDPDLESGFPAQAWQTGGTFWAGASVNTLVANFDSDPELEIFGSALSQGPLYAWNSSGTLLPGWPSSMNRGVVYPSAGRLDGNKAGLQVVGADFNDRLVVYKSDGSAYPGWPQDVAGGLVAPILVDIDGDGLDEIVIASLTELRIMSVDGSTLPGWPVSFYTDIAGLAVADLNKDGHQEIVTFTEPSNGYTCLKVFSDTGVSSPNCLAEFFGDPRMYPVIGDVDGDGNFEIIVNSARRILVLNTKGVIKKTLNVTQYDTGIVPILADMNQDGVPEIVVQTEDILYVFNGNGDALPGWPQTLRFPGFEDSTPAVGDVDGDQLPEIVIVGNGVNVYNDDGTLLVHKDLPAGFFTPAIADIDLDGRNEIICVTWTWNGRSEFNDSVWVYDLGNGPHGSIEWGQYGGSPQHRSVYPVPLIPGPTRLQKPGNIFLPMVSKPFAVKTNLGFIKGQINRNGTNLEGVPVELFSSDGQTWNSIASTNTDSKGQYLFFPLPTLQQDHVYSVEVNEQGNTNGLLGFWRSRILKTVRSDSQINLGSTNIADIKLTSPISGYSGSLPITFTWELRSSLTYEFYAFEIFDPKDGDPNFLDLPFRSNYGVTLSTLPNGFSLNTPIGWAVSVFGPDGSIGFSNTARQFTITGANVSDERN
ncbi:MAG: VCBS repeat-containing protein [Anaerolineales bacterium]|jgi:hypothetical protein